MQKSQKSLEEALNSYLNQIKEHPKCQVYPKESKLTCPESQFLFDILGEAIWIADTLLSNFMIGIDDLMFIELVRLSLEAIRGWKNHLENSTRIVKLLGRLPLNQMNLKSLTEYFQDSGFWMEIYDLETDEIALSSQLDIGTTTVKIFKGLFMKILPYIQEIFVNDFQAIFKKFLMEDKVSFNNHLFMSLISIKLLKKEEIFIILKEFNFHIQNVAFNPEIALVVKTFIKKIFSLPIFRFSTICHQILTLYTQKK